MALLYENWMLELSPNIAQYRSAYRDSLLESRAKEAVLALRVSQKWEYAVGHVSVSDWAAIN